MVLKRILKASLVGLLVCSLLFSPRPASGAPIDQTPPIPESKGECSVLAGIIVGLGLVIGVSPEDLEGAENQTFEQCLAGNGPHIYKSIKGMLQMIQEYHRIREACAFKVGRESLKGSLMSSSGTRKAIEDCVSLGMGSKE